MNYETILTCNKYIHFTKAKIWIERWTVWHYCIALLWHFDLINNKFYIFMNFGQLGISSHYKSVFFSFSATVCPTKTFWTLNHKETTMLSIPHHSHHNHHSQFYHMIQIKTKIEAYSLLVYLHRAVSCCVLCQQHTALCNVSTHLKYFWLSTTVITWMSVKAMQIFNSVCGFVVCWLDI